MKLLKLCEIILALLFTCIEVGHCQVCVFPAGTVVAAVGSTVNFNCFSSVNGVENITWLANYSVLASSSNVQQLLALQGGHLALTNLTLYYNMTNFACLVYYSDRQPLPSNGATLLLVHGPLSSVESLALTHFDGRIYLSWTAPSTHLTLHYLNITYCVYVNKSNSIVYQECNIVETEFRFAMPSDSTCLRYTFTVIPKSFVGDGPNLTISFLPPPSDDVTGILRSSDFSYSLIMCSPVCKGKLIFEDLDDGEIIALEDYELTIAGNNITFTNVLRFNRRYNVTVITSTFDAMATSFITISTHGVTDAVVMERNGIEVITLYSEHSSASGALFSFVFITESGDVDFTRSALLPLDRNTPPNHTLPFNLHPGHYRIYVYDIEQDGTLYNGVGYPAVTEELSINRTENGTENRHGTSTENCHISTSRDIIRVTCSMAGGFQVIALQSNANKVHLIYTNKSMDLQTPVIVQVERSGVYQVTMFAIREDSTFTYSEQAIVDVQIETTTELRPTTTLTDMPELRENSAVIGAVVGVLVVVAVIILVVWSVQRFAKTKGWSRGRTSSTTGGWQDTASFHVSRIGVTLEEGKESCRTISEIEATLQSDRELDPLLDAGPKHGTDGVDEEQAGLELSSHLAANAAKDLAEFPANLATDPSLPVELLANDTTEEFPALLVGSTVDLEELVVSVEETANLDNSEEEPFVLIGIERRGSKPNWRIVGLEPAVKKEQGVDYGGGGTFDQESNEYSYHGMPLIARTRDHDNQTHEAKGGSALPAFHEEVSQALQGDLVLDRNPQQDGTPLLGQKNAPNTITLQAQAEEAQQLNVTTDHSPNTPTLQTQALEVNPPASDHTSNIPTLQTQSLEVSLDSDHTPNPPTLHAQALVTQDVDVSPVEKDQLAGVEIESMSTKEPDTTPTLQSEVEEESKVEEEREFINFPSPHAHSR